MTIESIITIGLLVEIMGILGVLGGIGYPIYKHTRNKEVLRFKHSFNFIAIGISLIGAFVFAVANIYKAQTHYVPPILITQTAITIAIFLFLFIAYIRYVLKNN